MSRNIGIIIFSILLLIGFAGASYYFIQKIINPPANYGTPESNNKNQEENKPSSETSNESSANTGASRISEFSADKQEVNAGGEVVHLSWKGENVEHYEIMAICEETAAANMVLLNGEKLLCGYPQKISGTSANIGFEADASGEAKFELRAYGANGEIVGVKTISISANNASGNKIFSFSSDPTAIYSGGSSNLRWSADASVASRLFFSCTSGISVKPLAEGMTDKSELCNDFLELKQGTYFPITAVSTSSESAKIRITLRIYTSDETLNKNQPADEADSEITVYGAQ